METRTQSFNSKTILWAVLLLTLVFTSRSYSDPLSITVLNSQYATYVYDSYAVPPGTSLPPGYTPFSTNGITGYIEGGYKRTLTSDVPINDRLFDAGGGLVADARAGLFDMLAYTSTGGNQHQDRFIAHSAAQTDSLLTFSPLASQTANLTLQFSSFDLWFYTHENVRLFDVTSGHEVWHYHYDGQIAGGNIPWVSNPDYTNSPGAILSPVMIANLLIPTEFDAAHVYELSMHFSCGSDHDAEGASVQLLGLQVIPEPSAFALVSLGAAAWLARHRCRRGTRA